MMASTEKLHSAGMGAPHFRRLFLGNGTGRIYP